MEKVTSRSKITTVKHNKKIRARKRRENRDQANKEWRKRDLISRINLFVPSKHLLFLSRQRHHNTQCGIARHRSILRYLPNEPGQDANKFTTLWGITQITPKRLQTIDHSSKAMGQWRRRWITNFFFTYNTNPWRGHPYSTVYQGSKSCLRRQSKKRKQL